MIGAHDFQDDTRHSATESPLLHIFIYFFHHSTLVDEHETHTSTTSLQLRQTMRNQMDNLEEADMDFSQVVSTTVYLDNLADVPAFDEVYTKYFPGQLPAQTTIQQIAPAGRSPDKDEQYPDLEQVSLIAVRNSRGR